MDKLEVKNATIDYTKLGVQHTDHGILSFLIGLDYGGGGQGYGQLCLDTYDEAKNRRVPTELASGLLLAVDKVFSKDWEDLKGTPCRALASWEHVRAIGHYLKDSWLWFDRATMAFQVSKFDKIKKEVE